MLHCHGLVRLPNDPQLTITPYSNKGFYFSFRVFSQDSTKKLYYYKCNLFVEEKDLDEWKTKLQPGNMFLIENAQIDSFTKEEWSGTIHAVKLSRFHFKLLKVKPAGDS